MKVRTQYSFYLFGKPDRDGFRKVTRDGKVIADGGFAPWSVSKVIKLTKGQPMSLKNRKGEWLTTSVVVEIEAK